MGAMFSRVIHVDDRCQRQNLALQVRRPAAFSSANAAPTRLKMGDFI